MKRLLAIALLAMTLQACARSDTSPSYLGAAVIDSDDSSSASSPSADGAPPELRHVASNKVLGAMAYQKVTGRAVDASRLSGGH